MKNKIITHCRQTRQNNFSRKAEVPIPVLVILLLTIIAGTIHLWPQDENFAQPTKIEQTEATQLTQQEPTIEQAPPITAAITLEEPKQKIDPQLIEELKALKKEKKQQKIKILAEIKNIQQLKQQYTNIKTIGNIAIIETTPEEAEKIAQNDNVEQIATEKEYQLFIEDRITAFSINKIWQNNYTGKNIKIAILDTGIGPHDNLTITKAKSFVDDNPLDTEGHGTHVAGIAQKIAPEAQIYNAKVFKAKTAKTTAIIEAINWAIEEKADIISMSFGSSATDPILTSVLNDAIDKGVKIIAAAGNCKTNTCSGYFGVTYPGNIKEIITVGAIDDANNTASFSSSDTYTDYSKPDILAPGTNILSTAPNNQYTTKQGTSMSTPFVAGITALLLEKEGELTQEEVKQRLTANGIVIEPVKVLEIMSETKTSENLTEEPAIQLNQTEPPLNTTTNAQLLTSIPNFTLVKTQSVEQTPGKESKIAIYQKDEEYFMRVGYIEFETTQNLQTFLAKEIPYNQEIQLNGTKLYQAAKEQFIFWTHNNYFYWTVWDAENLQPTETTLLKEYIATYNPNGNYTLTKQEQQTFTIQAETAAELFSVDTTEDWWKIANSGCTDACDGDSYKTDLSSGTCDGKVNYLKKGTTYNDEWGCSSTYTDTCTSSTKLKEYYLACDDDSIQWCSCQGFYCKPDKTYYTTKDCTDYGTGYTCSSGACVAPACSYSPSCTKSYKAECKDKTKYDKSTASTACSGGCSYTYSTSITCSSGKYCSGTTYDTSPCTSCSTSCDGSCQSSTCYGTDPDCTSSGGVNSGACECTMTDAYWSTSSATEKDTVTLTVKGDSKCNGKSASLKIYEVDCLYDYSTSADCDDETVSINPSSATFSSGKLTTTWKTEWQDDGAAGLPEYYFIATADGNTLRSDTPDLEVTKKECTAGYTGETRCSGSTVERKYISTTCAESWIADTTCTTDQYCSSGSCLAKTCSDYGLTSCSTSGSGKKESSKTYTCENQYEAGTLLCWKYIATNGDSDYCDKLETFGLKCDRGEYDCDSNSECASGLTCQGGLLTLGDGCCKSTDTWDSSTKTCRGDVGESCTKKEECETNNCVSGKCKKLPLDATCTTSDQCESELCTSGKCSTIPCMLTTPTWSLPTTLEGSTVTLTTTGPSCEGKTATIDIYEDKFIDTLVKTISGISYSGKFTTTWMPPITGTPKEYYYKITPSTGDSKTSGTLTVLKLPSPEGTSCSTDTDCASKLCLSGKCTKPCTDVDGDGYGTIATPACPKTGKDCSDTTSTIYPGATELCNGKDDDCDGTTDEEGVCFGKLEVLEITSAPTSANQGDTITVKAKVKNIGTITDTLKLEAGIAPDYWEGTLFDFEEQAYTSVTKCCTGNEYYTAKEITLGPEETQEVTFTLKTPTVTTTDACSTNKNYKTAWDTSHEVIVGLYETCGVGYTHRITKDIKINDIACTQPSSCTTGTTCKFTGTTGTCQPKTCTDVCTKGTYTCNGNIIRECIEETCNIWKDVKTCMTGTACESGKSTCQDTQIDTILSIEEAGTTTVKKLTGDTATLKLKYVQQEEITLQYDSANFELQDCSTTFSMTKDVNCTLKVKGTEGTHSIKIKNGNGGYIQIIDNPSGLIITNKEKLYERYTTKSEVDALLNNAYKYAESNHFILYDLSKEIGTKHPWNIFSDYKETEYNPFMKDNSYSLETAQLVREKCQSGCKNTIILGDDYIVPHYRRDAQFLNNYWIFWDKEETDSIYSDIPYILRKEKTFSELNDLFYFNSEYSGKRMVIIKPSTMSPEMTKQLTTLKKVLEAKFHPDFEEIDSEEVYCNDDEFFSDFNGATLFVLGTQENNKAYNCMPFVSQLESTDSAFIEVNPWDGNNYAVIMNTDNPKVMEAFTAFVDTGKYEKATSKALWFAEVGLDTLGYLSILCAGAAIPCDTIVDGLSTDFYCAVKQDMTLCSVSAAMIAVPYIPAAPVKTAVKSFIKDVGHFAGQLMRDSGQEVINLFVRAFKRGEIDDTYTLLKNMGDCAFSTSSFEIQGSGCPSPVNVNKLFKTKSPKVIDKVAQASYKNGPLAYRIADAAMSGIDDNKLIRMLDSEIRIDGSSLSSFKQIGDKKHIGLMTDAKGNSYYFKRDVTGAMYKKETNDLERMSYRLNYVLDEGESIVKVPKARIIEGVKVDGELQTGLLIEDLGGDSLYNIYEQGMKTGKWKEGLPGQLDFFKYSKDITDAQREVMQKQIVRDFILGSTDRNLGNAIKTADGKIGFIDYEHSFVFHGDESPLFDVLPKVKTMLEDKNNLLLENPQFRELSDRWKLYSDESSGSLAERKKILDLLEPEVRKMEKLTIEDFDAAIKFEELADSKTVMEEIKKKLFGTTGKNGRISDFVKDFNALKASVEAKLK